MSRHAEIRFESPSCALISGPGTRELLRELTHRAPVWATRSKGWVVQPNRARDVIAILEHRGYDITVTGDEAAAPQTAPTLPDEAAPDEVGGLW